MNESQATLGWQPFGLGRRAVGATVGTAGRRKREEGGGERGEKQHTR